ncbi:MAG: TIGR01777 family protein [Vampirovibrio sp.]|nr:TIGR01777 family protein [Vampirovibrio sp.]
MTIITKPALVGQKILVSGASGLLGRTLISLLKKHGAFVTQLARKHSHSALNQQCDETRIVDLSTPSQATIEALEGFDVVVHLAGESIMGVWTAGKMQKIRNSRVQPTQVLSEALASTEKPPKTFICASAVGFYGEGGTTLLSETAPAGNQFLSQVCVDWEKACNLANHAGIRVVNTRFGMILAPTGGAFKAMLPPFQLGIGGILGDGKQLMSWVHIEDVAQAIVHCIITPTLAGAVNVVAPNPVTNAEFTHTLGKVLNRPTVLPAPAFVLKLLLGKLAEELLLTSQNVIPAKLQETGFVFRYPELASAFVNLVAHRRNNG